MKTTNQCSPWAALLLLPLLLHCTAATEETEDSEANAATHVATASAAPGGPQGNHSAWSRSGYSSVVMHGEEGDSQAASSSASFVSGGLTVQDPPKGWPFSEVTIHLPNKGKGYTQEPGRKPLPYKRWRKPKLPTTPSPQTHQVVHAHMFAPAPPPSPAPLPITTRRPEPEVSPTVPALLPGGRSRAHGSRSHRARDHSVHVGYSIGFGPGAAPEQSSHTPRESPSLSGDIIHGRPSATGETPRIPRMHGYAVTHPGASPSSSNGAALPNSRASSYSVANFYHGGAAVSHAVAHDDEDEGGKGRGMAAVTRVKVKAPRPPERTRPKYNKWSKEVGSASTSSAALSLGSSQHQTTTTTHAPPEQSVGESSPVASPLQSVVRDHALFVHHGGSDSHKQSPLRTSTVVHHPAPDGGRGGGGGSGSSSSGSHHHGLHSFSPLVGVGLTNPSTGGGSEGGADPLGAGSVLTSITPYPLMGAMNGDANTPKAYLATLSGAGGGGAVPALVIPMSHLQSLATGPLPVVATGAALLPQPTAPTATVFQGHSLPMATLASGFKSFVPTISPVAPQSKPATSSSTKSRPQYHHHHHHHGPQQQSVSHGNAHSLQNQQQQFTRLVLNQGQNSIGGNNLNSHTSLNNLIVSTLANNNHNGHNHNNNLLHNNNHNLNHNNHNLNLNNHNLNQHNHNLNQHNHNLNHNLNQNHNSLHHSNYHNNHPNNQNSYHNLNTQPNNNNNNHVVNGGGILVANNDGFRLNNVVPYVSQSQRPRNNQHRPTNHPRVPPLFNMKDLRNSQDGGDGSHKANGGQLNLAAALNLQGLGALNQFGSGLQSNFHGAVISQGGSNQQNHQNLQGLSSNLHGLNLQGLNLQGVHGMQGVQGLPSNIIPGSVQPLQTLQVASPALKNALQAQGIHMPSVPAGSLTKLPAGSSPMPVLSLSEYLKMTTGPHTFGGSSSNDFSQEALRQLLLRQATPFNSASQGGGSITSGSPADMQRALAAYNSMLSVAMFSTPRPGGVGESSTPHSAATASMMDLRPPPPRSRGH